MDPEFPFASTPLKEKRLAEERCSQTKPIYKIGGIGTVGLQSLYGIQHLDKLRRKSSGIELFCWPFNKKSKDHAQDAQACSKWLCEQETKNKLPDWLNPDNFKPELEKDDLQRASLEGWIAGVR